MYFRYFATALFLSVFLLSACGQDSDILTDNDNLEDNQEGNRIDTLVTSNGVQFVRTPDEYFQNLPDWSYSYQYVEIDGLRQAYAEDGPANGPVVLLLHGQPSWSYLYRTMIPILADAGYRVIAMDHLGMGRSDKPVDISDYSYLGHADRLERFIQQMGLSDINLFVQDWGSLIGLRVAGLNPDWFATISVGNGQLPVVPEGFQIMAPIENPDEIEDIVSPFADIPAQQVPYYDGCELIAGSFEFDEWAYYSMKGASYTASEVVEALTWFDLPEDVEAAYDAPFPDRAYMAGTRTFPALVNEVAGVNMEAWAGLTSYTKPFLTIWGANDNGSLGTCEAQQTLIDNVYLPTLALQIVTENCFKHNSMTSKMPLRIEISNTDDGYIEVKNNIQPKIESGESTGNGLNALTKRYELMNTSNGVIVEQSSNHFKVKLKLIN